MMKRTLEERIAIMETKLEETREFATWNSGPVNDALKIIVPMMKDQLDLMRDILASLKK